MIKQIQAENAEMQPNSKEIKILKEYFPSCFSSDGNFDFLHFKSLLKDKVSIQNEGYELNFLGKSYAKLLASLDTETIIEPDKEHNLKPENSNSENIYITGDNIDGLKHLLKSYSGKVKCIYIDPPYNTGTDGFVYNDKFNFSVAELVNRLSIGEDEATRILDLAKRGSASHSAWLMFMYPRLVLARDLLSKDGVIFISIDDNEQANLKLLCDSVFGEENNISNLVWEKKKKGSFLSNDITNIKEYILVYSYNKDLFTGLIGEINKETETYPCVNSDNARDIRIIKPGIKSNYKEKDYFLPKGSIISDTTMNLELKSDLVILDGKLNKELIIEGNWRYQQSEMTRFAENDDLYITRDLYLRRIVSDPRYKGLKDLLLRIGEDENSILHYDIDIENLQKTGWGSNEDADEEQRLLFGIQSLMSYPKPVILIMKLLASIRDKNLFVCDFFGGSATTSEAVKRLNTIDNGNRKYIIVQIGEDLDNRLQESSIDEKSKIMKVIDFLDANSYPHTLNYIGIERIKRAAKKIKEQYPDTTVDLGFKHYTLHDLSDTALERITQFKPDENLIFQNIYEEFGIETILTTWMVNDGYGFTAKPQELDLDGYKVWYYKKHVYLIEPGLTEDATCRLFEKYSEEGAFTPENIVMFGYSFNLTEFNMIQLNLKSLRDGNFKTNLDIRY
jgi:adenine specific DNA methylase Mod